MQSPGLPSQKIEGVLDYMQNNRVSFMDVLFYVLDSDSQRCASYRRRVFDDLESTLTRIDRHRRGREVLRQWTLKSMCEVVNREVQKSREHSR